MGRYTLVGVDGNAFNVMAYTGRALKETGHRDLEKQMVKEATSGDYNNLLCVCMKYLDIANASLDEEDWDDDCDDDSGWDDRNVVY